MYLTRMFLDTTKRAVMRALNDRNQLHGAIERAFSGERQHPLWRLDTLRGETCLLLLSEDEPDLTEAARQFGREDAWETRRYDPLLERIQDGTKWRFRLTANPTYSVPAPGEKRGKVQAHITPQHQSEWLMHQAERNGFSVKPEVFQVSESRWCQFYKGADNNRRVSLLAVTFEGVLTVTDAERFRETLCGGIGRGKAYGMGLLTVVRCDE